MTTYEITFTNTATGNTGTDRFTEPTVSLAKKAFKEVYRHADYTINSVVPVADGVTATKEQEREALAKIKAIIATLGDNSYIGVALTGCLDDAESNIENDFADCMFDRWNSARDSLKKAQAENEVLEAKLDNKELDIAELKKQNEKLLLSGIKKDDLEDVIALAKAELNDAEKAVKEHAAKIVEYADSPASSEFIDAVHRHRQSKERYDHAFALVNRLCDIKPAGN